MSRLFFSLLSLVIILAGTFLITPESVFALERRTIDNAFEGTDNYLDPVITRTGVAKTNIPTVIGNLARVAFWVSGMAFFGLMVYGGFLWMSSHGNEDMLKRGQNTIIAALIGIAILVSAYAITNLVTSRLITGEPAPRGATPPSGGAVACCIDWVASQEGDTEGTAVERLTTEADCKAQGESAGGGDNLFGPGPAQGTWLFFPEITTVPTCTEKVTEYD